MKDKAEFSLEARWRNGRNEGKIFIDETSAIIDFLGDIGLFDEKLIELWQRRVLTCPGHDDEGDRDWCAYCGKMPKENPIEEFHETLAVDSEPKS